MCQLEHVVSERDDNAAVSDDSSNVRCHVQLRSLSLGLNVVGDDGDVFEVQGSVNLVHEVEWSRLKDMQGEHQSQRSKGLFST